MDGMGTVYAGVRRRITELVSGLGDDEAARPVPTCPEWTVRDVLAHLTGTCADIMSFNLQGVASEPWTAAQVTARKERALAEILDEWAEIAPQTEALVDQVPSRRGEQWVTDATAHEHDLRLALGRPGARDSQSLRIAVQLLVDAGVAPSFHVHRVGPVEIRTPEQAWVVGAPGPPPGADHAALRAEGDAVGARVLDEGYQVPPPEAPPVAVLRVDEFELFRGVTGRRSAAQVARWDWSVDPAPLIPALEFGPFRFAAADVEE